MKHVKSILCHSQTRAFENTKVRDAIGYVHTSLSWFSLEDKLHHSLNTSSKDYWRNSWCFQQCHWSLVWCHVFCSLPVFLFSVISCGKYMRVCFRSKHTDHNHNRCEVDCWILRCCRETGCSHFSLRDLCWWVWSQLHPALTTRTHGARAGAAEAESRPTAGNQLRALCTSSCIKTSWRVLESDI